MVILFIYHSVLGFMKRMWTLLKHCNLLTYVGLFVTRVRQLGSDSLKALSLDVTTFALMQTADRYVILAQPTKIDPLAQTRRLTTMMRDQTSLKLSFSPLAQQNHIVGFWLYPNSILRNL